MSAALTLWERERLVLRGVLRGCAPQAGVSGGIPLILIDPEGILDSAEGGSAFL